MKRLYPELETYIKQMPKLVSVSAKRQKLLRDLAAFISDKLDKDEIAELVFICTHNSRRSILAQVWAAAAAHYHGLENVITYSGGTEVTAFHPNAMAALERAGFRIDKLGGKNPVQLVRFAEDHKGVQCFSKKYSDKYNPNSGFCAIMTCSDADEACPVVFGMKKRVSLTYEDPKAADGSPKEQAIYDERTRQIGMEMFFLMGNVSTKKLR
jgi:arsenate reductase (thioredoxin)